MATWADLHVATTTYQGASYTTAHTVTLSQPAAEGHRLVMAVGSGSSQLASTPTGWTLDRSAQNGWQRGYVLSRAVPAGGLSSVDLSFTAEAHNGGATSSGARPLIVVVELANVGPADTSAAATGLTYNSSTVNLPSRTPSQANTVSVGSVTAGVNGGQPHVTWASWSSAAALSVASGDFDSVNALGVAYQVHTSVAAFTDTASISGGPYYPTGVHAVYPYTEPVSSPNEGSTSGSFAWAGSAAGSAPPVPSSSGSASGSHSWAGFAAGSTSHDGSTSGAHSWAGSATGSAPQVGVSTGAAAGSHSWTGAAAGSRTSSGDATGAVAYVGSATGIAPTVGVKAGAATGSVRIHGHSDRLEDVPRRRHGLARMGWCRDRVEDVGWLHGRFARVDRRSIWHVRRARQPSRLAGADPHRAHLDPHRRRPRIHPHPRAHHLNLGAAMTTFTVGDTAPALTGTCMDGDTAADLSGATLSAHIRQPGGTVLTKPATATDAVNGAWQVAWVDGDLSQSGAHKVEVQVTYAGGQVQTFGPSGFYVNQEIA